MGIHIRVRANEDIKSASLVEVENVLTHQLQTINIEYQHTQIAPSDSRILENPGKKDTSRTTPKPAASRLNIF